METYTKHINRGLLAISGTDAFDFLQSAITQDIQNLKEGQLLYGAHLTPQGKYMFDFFIGKRGEKFILDCLKTELMPLAQSLHKFVVNKNVDFEDLSDDYAVITSANAIENAELSSADPRHTDLGHRNCLAVKECANLNISEDTSGYHKKRINLIVPENDGIQGKTLINELNFERINGVSFDKGCYVGQELTARTKFRTEPKKRLYLVEISTKETLEKGASIMAETTEVGWLLSHVEGRGIALLRLRYTNSQNLEVNGHKIIIIKRDDE